MIDGNKKSKNEDSLCLIIYYQRETKQKKKRTSDLNFW